MSPSVSVIIPSLPARAAFLDIALDAIERQTLRPLEVLVEGGAGTVGAKRNALCNRAMGDIIVHWDDDNPSTDDRLARQVDVLQEGAHVCGTSIYHVFDARSGGAQAVHRHAVSCISLAYWRSAWENFPFRADVRTAEVNSFLRYHRRNTVDLKDPFVCYFIHPGCTSTHDRYRNDPEAAAEVQRLFGVDLAKYRALTG